MLMTDAAQIVVIGILCHPSVEVRPCQNVHRVLLVLDRLDRDFRQEVIVHHMRGQMRLDWKAFA